MRASISLFAEMLPPANWYPLRSNRFRAAGTKLPIHPRVALLLRGTMKKIADGDQWSMPATIDDSAILGEIARAR
jgi:propionyl-CoA synthetase